MCNHELLVLPYKDKYTLELGFMQWTMYKSTFSTIEDCNFSSADILSVHISFSKIKSKLKETVQDDKRMDDDHTADYKPDESVQKDIAAKHPKPNGE